MYHKKFSNHCCDTLTSTTTITNYSSQINPAQVKNNFFTLFTTSDIKAELFSKYGVNDIIYRFRSMNNQAVNILEIESTTVTMACKIPTAFLILVLSFSSEMHA